MTNYSRITKMGLLILGLLALASVSWSQTCPPAAEKIAQAYGIDAFGQIDAVRSTFNIDFPGLKVAQSWIWEPKADRVTYEGKDKAGNPVKITYLRSQLSSQPDNVKNEIDPSFNKGNWPAHEHAVADEGGNIVAHVRMDNAWIGSIDIAMKKAYTSRAFDIETKELAKHSQSGNEFFGIHVSNSGKIMIFAGGIPLKRDGKVVGAIGVSGGSGDQDHAVAAAGAAAF